MYPSVSCILDFIRCSVAYNSIELLLNGLNKFKLFRLLFLDIKFNIIFINENNESMIVEIQFLFNFLLFSKKLSHKYYGIIRKELFIDSIKNNIYI